MDMKDHLARPQAPFAHGKSAWYTLSLAGQTFEEGRERLVTVVDFPCAIAECCDYQSDCSSHVTI